MTGIFWRFSSQSFKKIFEDSLHKPLGFALPLLQPYCWHFSYSFVLQARVMLEVFLSTISSNPSLASLVHKFNDRVVNAFRQDNIPDGNTQTIADLSHTIYWTTLRCIHHLCRPSRIHRYYIHGCFEVGSYFELRFMYPTFQMGTKNSWIKGIASLYIQSIWLHYYHIASSFPNAFMILLFQQGYHNFIALDLMKFTKWKSTRGTWEP